MKADSKFIIGAGLGLALGYWLNTDKGRKIRTELSEEAKNKVSQMQESGSGLIDKATDMVSELRAQGEKYLREMKKSSSTAKKDIEQFVEKEMSEMKKKLLSELETSANSK